MHQRSATVHQSARVVRGERPPSVARQTQIDASGTGFVATLTPETAALTEPDALADLDARRAVGRAPAAALRRAVRQAARLIGVGHLTVTMIARQ
jgi:hypothetical protein